MKALKTVAVALGVTLAALIVIPLAVLAGLFVWLKLTEEADEEILVPYGHLSQGLGKVNFFKGKGCATCNFTGMKGRVAIYEVMPISQELRDLMIRNAPTAEIRETAQGQGMRTLRQNALQKVLEGTMTIEEVIHLKRGDER